MSLIIKAQRWFVLVELYLDQSHHIEKRVLLGF